MALFLAIVIVLWAVPMWANYALAKSKKRNHRLWLLAGFLFSYLSTVLLALLTKKDQTIIY